MLELEAFFSGQGKKPEGWLINKAKSMLHIMLTGLTPVGIVQDAEHHVGLREDIYVRDQQTVVNLLTRIGGTLMSEVGLFKPVSEEQIDKVVDEFLAQKL